MNDEREKYIQFLRDNGFNCFPIPYNKKEADYRYKSINTERNQPIKDDENYGYIPIEGEGTCIIDFDDKEKYREFVERIKSGGCTVIETPHGWHVPLKNLKGNITKTLLYDYKINKDKQIIEIQGPKHYVIGPGSKVDGNDYKLYNLNIWDAENADFHDLIERLCKKCGVVPPNTSRSTYEFLRTQFKEGKIPRSGQSNVYFNQAALVCNTEGISREECFKKLRSIYDKWVNSNYYSSRPWSNIEAKINEVYDKDMKIAKGRPKTTNSLDFEEVSTQMIELEKLYSDKESNILYQLKKGYLKVVSHLIENYIKRKYKTKISDTNEIMSLIVACSPDPPEPDRNYIALKSGMYNRRTKQLEDFSDKIGILGFPDVNFIPNPKCPNFHKFFDSLFPSPRCKQNAMETYRSALAPEKDIRFTVCYGPTGTGKSTFRDLLIKVVGPDYTSPNDDLQYFFEDKYATAELIGKTLFSCAEAPTQVKEFNKLKRLTGEKNIHIRKMRTEGFSVENMLTLVFDANNLFKIPETESGPLFRRINLIEFNVKFSGSANEDEYIVDKIIESERDEIISYLLMQSKHEYDDPDTVRQRWEQITIPEKMLVDKYFTYSSSEDGMSTMEIKNYVQALTDEELDAEIIRKILRKKGYSQIGSLWKGITIKKEIDGQKTLI